jgi:hypothetical protein
MSTTVSAPQISTVQQRLRELLREAKVQLNGDRSWDPQVHDDRLYERVFSEGSLAVGEAYMDRWWDCELLDQLFYRILRAGRNQLWQLVLSPEGGTGAL